MLISVTILSFDKSLTTQEAADILNVSRPYLIGLLEKGEIPYQMTGRHRRIRLEDLMTYKNARHIKREESINELISLSEDMGLYE